MSDTSHRTTSESQAVKRAKAREESKRAHVPAGATGYFVLHRWLAKADRRRALK